MTHKKIWNGVTKDVGYLRNILNEVYFLKFRVSLIVRTAAVWFTTICQFIATTFDWLRAFD